MKKQTMFSFANETLKDFKSCHTSGTKLFTTGNTSPTRFRCKCKLLSRIWSIKPILGGKKTFRKRIVVYTNSLVPQEHVSSLRRCLWWILKLRSANIDCVIYHPYINETNLLSVQGHFMVTLRVYYPTDNIINPPPIIHWSQICLHPSSYHSS